MGSHAQPDNVFAPGEDPLDDGLVSAAVRGLAPPPPLAPMAADALDLLTAGGPRDRIVILGRRGSGKTVFLTRLYEALWRGCQLVNGRYVPERQAQAGDSVRTLSARARDGRQHSELRRLAMDLDAGRWPVSTQATEVFEIDITLDGRKKLLAAMDYPGEVFRTAFSLGANDPASRELREAVDRAAALILLVDPAVALKPAIDREEDSFGLVAAVARVRSSPSGEDVPVVVVLTKCDLHVPVLRAGGGPRELAEQLLPQVFRELGGARTVAYASSATSVVKSPRGAVIPRKRRAPRDVIEPLVFCLDWIDRSEEQELLSRAQLEASFESAERLRREQAEEEREERRARVGMVTFWIGVIAILGASALLTLWLLGRL